MFSLNTTNLELYTNINSKIEGFFAVAKQVCFDSSADELDTSGHIGDYISSARRYSKVFPKQCFICAIFEHEKRSCKQIKATLLLLSVLRNFAAFDVRLLKEINRA